MRQVDRSSGFVKYGSRAQSPGRPNGVIIASAIDLPLPTMLIRGLALVSMSFTPDRTRYRRPL